MGRVCIIITAIVAASGFLLSCTQENRASFQAERKAVSQKLLEIGVGISEDEVTHILGLPFSTEKGPFNLAPDRSASYFTQSPCFLERATIRNNYIYILKDPPPASSQSVLVYYIKVYMDAAHRVVCVQVDLNGAVMGLKEGKIEAKPKWSF